jgi:hypothetical protein
MVDLDKTFKDIIKAANKMDDESKEKFGNVLDKMSDLMNQYMKGDITYDEYMKEIEKMNK